MMAALSSLLTFIVLQGAWLLAVWGAAAGRFWLGPAVVALLVAAHLVRSWPRHRVWHLVVLALMGTAVDSLQSFFQVLSFDGAPAVWLCPPWIISLWVHFGLMLLGPLDFLHRRLPLAAALGMIGGPLAYAGGVGMGAASFGLTPALSLGVLAMVWGVACPLAVLIVTQPQWQETQS